MAAELNLIEIDPFDEKDPIEGDLNKQLKSEIKQFLGMSIQDQVFQKFKEHILQEAQGQNCQIEMTDQLNDVQIENNLVFKCLKRQ